MTSYLPPLSEPVRTIGARTVDFSRSVAVMAIINRTPDSFYDRGATFALEAAVGAGLGAVSDGAQWLDVGGVPFAPGPALDWREETERVVPVIESLRAKGCDAIISVDTFDARVARAALEAGADVVNDTTGLSDPDLAPLVAESGAHLVLTHSLAAPRTVYPRPHYDDVAAEVRAFLEERIDQAQEAGIPASHLFVDPGPDLNKNTLDSLELTRHFSRIASLGLPALAAVSNKDFIGETLDAGKEQRLVGSVAVAMYAMLQGARVLRMHDVAAAVDAARMFEAINGWTEPYYLVHNMGEANQP